MPFGLVDAIKIYVYADDHNPPHFHALAAERSALIHIADLFVAETTLSRSELRRVLEWASTRQAALMEEWNALNP
jgi:hypothetical protein